MGEIRGWSSPRSIRSIPGHALLYIKTQSIFGAESTGISDWQEQSKVGLGEEGIRGLVRTHRAWAMASSWHGTFETKPHMCHEERHSRSEA